MAKNLKQKIYWLSFDLGVGGDYNTLYQWLDDHNAKPCGNSVACFNYEYNEGEDPDKKLKNELSKKLKLSAGNKLYIIRRREGEPTTVVGGFIYGKRNAAPWEGYGLNSTPEEDV